MGERSPLPWPGLLEKLLYFELCGILHSLAEQMTPFLIPDMGKMTGMRGELELLDSKQDGYSSQDKPWKNWEEQKCRGKEKQKKRTLVVFLIVRLLLGWS